MSVITVSGGWYRGGLQLAQAVADNLHYRCIGRDDIIEKAAAGGASEADLQAALLEPPSLFDRMITHKKYLYLTHLQAALAEEVKDGRVIYHGYAGHLLLDGAGPVFRLRLIAAEEPRIEAIRNEMGLSHDEAKAHLSKVDHQRKKWTRYLYGVDWEDASHYDMVLNIGHLFQLGDVCEIVTSAVRQHKCFEFTQEHRAAMYDFALASRVRAELATHAPTSNCHIDKVEVSGGKVTVTGILDETEQITEIESVVSAIPGVTTVDLHY